MAGPGLLPQQDRAVVAARRRLLEPGRHLAGVHRVDPAVALGGGEQHRRVAGAVRDPVVGRVGVQPGELLGLIGIAVLGDPQPGDEEAVVAEHVEQRDRDLHGTRTGRVAG